MLQRYILFPRFEWPFYRERVFQMRMRRRTPMLNVSRAFGIAGAAVVVALLLRNWRQIPDRIRTFNKHILNPLVLKSAGTAYSPFAVICHVGRRSGKAYETPIIVVPIVDGFVIELTYGPGVDWYRNVLAAGHCTVIWHDRAYVCEGVEALETETGLLAFPRHFRFVLQLMDRRDFVKMKCRLVGPVLLRSNNS